MQRLERLVVHMREAVRLASRTSDAELRVALILLDSAAELLMHRLASDRVERRRWSEESARHYRWLQERLGVLTADQMQALVDAESRTLSKSRKKRIEREFDAKADLISDDGFLSVGEARCLKKLHQYRNATYHRDDLRSQTLRTSVRIYVYLTCQMMIRFPVSWMLVSATVPPGLLDFRHPLTGSKTDWQRQIGEQLLEQMGLASLAPPSIELSQHVLDRLENVSEALEEGAAEANSLRYDDDVWTAADLLTFVQLPRDRQLRVPFDTWRRTRVPVSMRSIGEWEQRASSLATVTDGIEAFATFADLEDEIEPIESAIIEEAIAIETETQRRLDESRGK